MTQSRCSWCGDDPLYVDYHDTEWGVPEKNDQALFEMLLLEGAQAGLSWITVLRKREGYRKLFHQFDPVKMAKMTDQQLETRLQNPAIIRNRLKVFGYRKNAQAYLKHFSNDGDFSDFIWSFVDHKTRVNRWESLKDIPGSTEESNAMSKALKEKGFTFVGSTICYAFMQASGLVNDHLVSCFRHKTD